MRGNGTRSAQFCSRQTLLFLRVRAISRCVKVVYWVDHDRVSIGFVIPQFIHREPPIGSDDLLRRNVDVDAGRRFRRRS